MKYIGLYVWAIVLSIIGFNMFPKIMFVWAVAITFAGFMDRRLHRKRQKKKEMERNVETCIELVEKAKRNLKFNEEMCDILGLDPSTNINVESSKKMLDFATDELEKAELELRQTK